MAMPFIIAEAGVNHNGDRERALALVDAAADAGADAVKFQTFSADRLVTATSSKARYQIENMGSDESQLEMLRALELSHEAHHELLARCRERGIEFMSTAFDLQSLRFLIALGIARVKIPSGDVTAHPLLLEAGRTGKPIILSTGMCTLAEIDQALAVLAFAFVGTQTPGSDAFLRAYRSEAGRAALAERVTILHCVTEYPAPPAAVNLRAMGTIRAAFGLPVGYSDHANGIAIPVAAAALGAVMIEKHFTLDRALPGPDHAASLEPGELKAMIAGIHDAVTALGDGVKEPNEAEMENRKVVRRSLHATQPIQAGELFGEANVGVMRPGDGLAPALYWDLLGRVANRDYAPGERLEL